MKQSAPLHEFYSDVRLRVYFLDKLEHMELIGRQNGRDILMFEASAIPGEWAADFLYGDFDWAYEKAEAFREKMDLIEESADPETIWEQILGHAQNLPADAHPYFAALTQQVFSLHDASRKPASSHWKLRNTQMRNLRRAFQKLPEDAQVLGADVLSTESDSNLNAALRYWRCCAEEKTVWPELDYGRIKTDLIGRNRSHLLRQDSLKPFVLSAEDMLDHGAEPIAVEMLYPQSLQDLYQYEKAYCLRNDVHFRVCKNCGRLFAVQGNGKAEYCDRPADITGGIKTCRQVGAIRLYQKKQQQNPAVQAYTKAYKTRNARIRYGLITKEQFQKWATEARVMRDRCVAGKITQQELEEWLNRD